MKIEKHIEGKRFSKREVTTFVREEGDTPIEDSNKRIEYFKKEGRVVGNKIIMGENFDDRLKNLIAETKLYIQQDTSNNSVRDSELDFAERILLNAKVALNEKNKIFSRLEFAFELGMACQQLKTYRMESNDNSKNSKGRKRNWPELDDWLLEQYIEPKGLTVEVLWENLPKDLAPDSDTFFINRNDELEYSGDHGTRRNMKLSSFKKYMTKFKCRNNI